MAAGSAIVVVALVCGTVVYRSLSVSAWAPMGGEASKDAARRPAPEWQMAPPPLPVFPRPEDRATYEKGRRLLATGEARVALGPLTEAARRFPSDAAVVHDYGLALERAGEVDRALFQLEHAARLAPAVADYRRDLVRALVAAGRKGPAARQIDELLARDPTDPVAAEMLARLASPPAGAPPAAEATIAGNGGTQTRAAPAVGAFTNADLGRPPAPRSPVPVFPVVTLPAAAPAAPAGASPPA
jgi:predicted Zn-dependent protease